MKGPGMAYTKAAVTLGSYSWYWWNYTIHFLGLYSYLWYIAESFPVLTSLSNLSFAPPPPLPGLILVLLPITSWSNFSLAPLHFLV